jgi:hypothetical protein
VLDGWADCSDVLLGHTQSPSPVRLPSRGGREPDLIKESQTQSPLDVVAWAFTEDVTDDSVQEVEVGADTGGAELDSEAATGADSIRVEGSADAEGRTGGV